MALAYYNEKMNKILIKIDNFQEKIDERKAKIKQLKSAIDESFRNNPNLQETLQQGKQKEKEIGMLSAQIAYLYELIETYRETQYHFITLRNNCCRCETCN